MIEERTITSNLENTVDGLVGRTLVQAVRIRSLEADLDRVLTALCADTVDEAVAVATALIDSLDVSR